MKQNTMGLQAPAGWYRLAIDVAGLVRRGLCQEECPPEKLFHPEQELKEEERGSWFKPQEPVIKDLVSASE